MLSANILCTKGALSIAPPGYPEISYPHPILLLIAFGATSVYFPKVYFPKVYFLNAYFPKVYLSKVYFYVLYLAYVSSKVCEFILLWNRLLLPNETCVHILSLISHLSVSVVNRQM